MNSSDEKNENGARAKSGVVAIIGRPSAGKSTFLNSVCKQNVSIVSPMPQTTRNSIRGIVNEAQGQIVFIDTPGYHQSEKKLNLKLQENAKSALDGCDAVLYLIDASRAPGEEEKLTSDLLKKFSQKIVVAINKVDLTNADSQKAADFAKSEFPEIPENRIVKISAKKSSGLDAALAAIFEILPEGEKLYPEDFYTDQEVGFRISEIIRGEAINRLEEEIPHAIYVEIADMEFKNDGKKLWVRAFLCVERESQKGIVIGKSAAMIKTIRLESLKKLGEIFDYKIDLDLSVKVDKNWRQRDKTLGKILG